MQRSLPLRLQRDREEPMRRVLRGLPIPVLDALLGGLSEADELSDGVLFYGEQGGCAVGVMLRRLFPAYAAPQPCRRWPWRARKTSIRELRPDISRELPHLAALEQVFDRTVRLARIAMNDADDRQIMRAVGSWLAAEVQTEIQMRHLRVGFEELESQIAPLRELDLDQDPDSDPSEHAQARDRMPLRDSCEPASGRGRERALTSH